MNPHQLEENFCGKFKAQKNEAPRKLLNGVKIQAPEECYEKAPTVGPCAQKS